MSLSQAMGYGIRSTCFLLFIRQVCCICPWKQWQCFLYQQCLVWKQESDFCQQFYCCQCGKYNLLPGCCYDILLVSGLLHNYLSFKHIHGADVRLFLSYCWICRVRGSDRLNMSIEERKQRSLFHWGKTMVCFLVMTTWSFSTILSRQFHFCLVL